MKQLGLYKSILQPSLKKKRKRAQKIEAGITRRCTSRRSSQKKSINYADGISSEEEEKEIVTINDEVRNLFACMC